MLASAAIILLSWVQPKGYNEKDVLSVSADKGGSEENFHTIAEGLNGVNR